MSKKVEKLEPDYVFGDFGYGYKDGDSVILTNKNGTKTKVPNPNTFIEATKVVVKILNFFLKDKIKS